MSMLVVGQKYSPLVQAIASKLHTDSVAVTVTRYQDTESFVDIAEPERISDAEILLIHQCSFSEVDAHPIGEQLFDFLLTVTALKRAGASKLIALFPYLPFARQDKTPDILPARIYHWGTMLKQAGVDALLTLELHSLDIISQFPLPITSISLAPLWESEINNLSINRHDLCLVTPDAGGCTRVQALASRLGASVAFATKTRTARNQTILLSIEGNVANKICFIIDDIIDSGHTALGTARLLKEHKASQVSGCFAHALLSNGALERLTPPLFDTFIITNSLLHTKDHLEKFAQHAILVAETEAILAQACERLYGKKV